MTALTLEGLPRKRVRPGAPMSERIELHTDRTGDHWLWLAAIDNNGYGRLCVNRRLLYAHRVAYEAYVGPIPEGLELDHLCRVRRCCNPEHLEPVTHVENVRRSPIHHASKESCPQGHPYDWRVQGRRRCSVCYRAYQRIYQRLWSALTPEQRAARKAAGLPVVDLAAHFAEQQEIAA